MGLYHFLINLILDFLHALLIEEVVRHVHRKVIAFLAVREAQHRAHAYRRALRAHRQRQLHKLFTHSSDNVR
jgi:hypothetical protein